MTPTSEIDDPTWNDIFDRDKEIKRLLEENAVLRRVLDDKEQRIRLLETQQVTIEEEGF
jgi:hypothetical protein